MASRTSDANPVFVGVVFNSLFGMSANGKFPTHVTDLRNMQGKSQKKLDIIFFNRLSQLLFGIY